MAVSTLNSLDKVKEELSCEICYEQFINPKVLPCFHTFCQKCLEDMRRRSRDPQISCPTCRCLVPLPELEDVQKLRNNFLINRVIDVLQFEQGGNPLICTNCDDSKEARWRCIDCSSFLCVACKDAHERLARMTRNHRLRNLDDEGLSDMPDIEAILFRPINCGKHDSQELKLYCYTCEVCACALCFATEHQGHVLCDVGEAAEKQKIALRNLVTNTKKHSEEVEEAIKETSAMEEKIDSRVKALDDMIDATVEDMVDSVKKKAEELHKELADIKKRKQKVLQFQKEELGVKQAQLESVICFAEEAVVKGREVEILAVKDQLVKRLKQLATSEKFGVEENCIIDCNFDIAEAKLCLSKSCTAASNVVPYLTIITAQEYLTEGNRSAISIYTMNKAGNLAYYKGDNLTVEVVTPNRETLIGDKLGIVNHQNGQYTLSLRPELPGVYSVFVAISGEQIRKKPHTMYASRNYSNIYYASHGFGSEGNDYGQFSYPTGIDVSETKEMAIADCLNNRVQVLGLDGTVLWVFGSEGTADGQLSEPKGVAFAKDGSVLVLDTGNNRIQVFTKNGKFLRTFGRKGTEAGQFNYPLGISVDQKGRILVADTTNCRIQVFNSNYQFLFQFGDTGPAKLKEPESALFFKSNFIVADTNNNCLKFFDHQGQFLRSLGAYGKRNGQFHSPSHLSTDSNGFIFVNDFNNHRIQVFRPEGAFIRTIGGHGTWSSYLQYPRNVVVMEDGRVAVSDCGNHRIQIF